MQKLRLTFQGRKPRFRECSQEWGRAAIEDRRLGTVHVDCDVIDFHAGDGGEHVLYRVHGVIALSKLGAALAAADFADVGANSRQSGTVRTSKYDPLPGPRWLKGELAANSKVQSDPLHRRRARQRLPAHFDSGSSSSFSSRRIIPANLNNAAEARRDSLCGRAG